MDITTTKTVILAADASRSNGTVIIQNTGSVAVNIGIGAENIAALDATTGVVLSAGALLKLTVNEAAAAISGITASGTGAIRVTII